MGKILLDYFMPISVSESTPEASTAFLKQVCVIATPKAGQEANVGTFFECTSMTQVAARTDNTDCQKLFDAGMSKVFLLLADSLDLAEEMEAEEGEFYTVLISSDFDDDDVEATQAEGLITITSYADLLVTAADTVEVAGVVFTAQSGAATLGTATFRAATSNAATATSLAAQINGHAVAGAKVLATVDDDEVTVTSILTGEIGNTYTLDYTDNGAEIGLTVSGSGTLTGGDGLDLGSFDGVIGYASEDADFLATFAADSKRCGFFMDSANGAATMFYAFGKLLSNLATWQNQQYISTPVDDGVTTLGQANSLFDDKVSFAITDDEFGKRLALFACGGEAIVAPYIMKNLSVDLQSRALTWISANQPQYTNVNASLLEQRLQEDVINQLYIQTQLIEAGVVQVTLQEDNFVATGAIDIAKPTALWRIFSTMGTTL